MRLLPAVIQRLLVRFLMISGRGDATCPSAPEQYQTLPHDVRALCREQYDSQSKYYCITWVCIVVGIIASVVPVFWLGDHLSSFPIGLGAAMIWSVGIIFTLDAIEPVSPGPLHQEVVVRIWDTLLTYVIGELDSDRILSTSEPDVLQEACALWLASSGVDPIVYRALAAERPGTAGEVVEIAQMLAA